MRVIKILIFILSITLSTSATRIAISSGNPGSKENSGGEGVQKELVMRTPEYDTGDGLQQGGPDDGSSVEDFPSEEEMDDTGISAEDPDAKISSGEDVAALVPGDDLPVKEASDGGSPVEEPSETGRKKTKLAEEELVKRSSQRKAVIPAPELEEFSMPLHTGPIEIPATVLARYEGPVPETLIEDTAVLVLDNEVDRYMARMTLEQKIGQRFITNIEGSELSEKLISLIRDEYIGGVIIYPWNIKNKRQVKKLTRGIQKTSSENDPPLNLFISVDQEGGRVNAFGFEEMAHFPAAYYWTQYDDPDFVEAAAYVINKEIAELGCNMNFAPVLDLYGIPDKTVIGDRSMGRDPSAIAEYGKFYVKGARKAGVIPVIKHFPGHGSSTVDSHVDLPVIDLEERELQQRDFKPFREVIEDGVDVVMTAHVIFRKIDPEYPGTLSEKILRGLLREQYGFEGVIISDGLAMGALSNNYEITDTLRQLFKAGVDLILVHSKYDIVDLKNRVLELYEQGEITEEEIDEGVERILRLKIDSGLISQ